MTIIILSVNFALPVTLNSYAPTAAKIDEQLMYTYDIFGASIIHILYYKYL